MGLESRQVPPGTPAPILIDALAAAERLAGAIRFPTVSILVGSPGSAGSVGDAAGRDTAAFFGLHQYLLDTFPNVSRVLTREAVANFSLLYTWRGTNAALPPVVLLSHLDVVPAEAGGWTHGPFSGDIADGRIWGRGTIDDKSGVLGLLEAVEALIASGFIPVRTIYLAFGHNEEGSTDPSGARAIARELAARGVRDAWLLDEGGLIYDGVAGVARPVAFVGITEKTPINVELHVRAAGGHASMPPRETAVGTLARAIDKIEGTPMPARLDGAAREMFQTLAPEMVLPKRFAFANLWFMQPEVLRQLASKPETNAIIRTTIAATQIEGSPRANMLATDARAVLNIRLLPGDSVNAVLAHLHKVIGDPRVEIVGAGPPDPYRPATPIARIDTPEFAALARAIRAVYPDVLVSPYLTMAATDARHYSDVAPNAYRFLPIFQDGALETVHGVNEHVRIDAYEKAIRVYATVMRELAGR